MWKLPPPPLERPMSGFAGTVAAGTAGVADFSVEAGPAPKLLTART